MAIVVSHIADDFATLTERALREVALADLVELRLDRIGHPGTNALEDFCARCPKPVIVSCNGPEAFGTYEGSVEEQLQILHDAAEAGARFVDIDYRFSLDLGEVKAPCHRIVSRHDPKRTPDDLEAFTEEVREVLYEGDVTKVVAQANSCEDGLRMLAWLRTTKGIVAFSSGEKGSFTRLLAPIFGSPFTYCAPVRVPGQEGGEATAPGQIPVNEFQGLLPPGGISQETAILGVVGNPIGHSYSPWVHGMALKAARLDVVYTAFEPEDFGTFLELTQDANYRGFSITAPFKQDAFRLAGSMDEASRRTGAVNTYVREKEGWHALNTDVPAIRDTLEQGFRIHARRTGGRDSVAGARVVILGTGGAARAAAWAVKSLEGAPVVVGRSPERAQALAEDIGCESLAWDELSSAAYDGLIHTTPVGSDACPDQAVLDAEALRRETLVLDAVYRPIRTPLLARAVERDCTPIPGGEWFVRQAALQFRLFTNVEPDEDLMRKSFEHAHETTR